MITVENQDTKKYFVYSAQKRFFIAPGTNQTFEGEIVLLRTYSRFYVLDLFIRGLLFLLCVMFVFLDTDYQNDDLWLVLVKYRCIAKSKELTLKIQRSHLMNITKSGDLQADFSIKKPMLIAHIISVFIYSVAAIALFLFLAIYTSGEVVLPTLFYILTVVSVFAAAYMILSTFKKYFKTLEFLTQHYKDYSY